MNARSTERGVCGTPRSQFNLEFLPSNALERSTMPSVHRPIGFPIGRAQSIAGRQAEPPAAPRQPVCRSRRLPPIRRQAPAVLPDCAAPTSLPDSSIDAGGVSSPGRPSSSDRVISSPLSSSSCAPAPPVSARTTRHCLAADVARHQAGFYLEHTPPLRRFKHLVDLLE